MPFLGLLGGNLVLATVRSCPHFALDNVIEASSDPWFVAASTGLGCVQEGPGFTLGWACQQHGALRLMSKHHKHLRIHLHPSLPTGRLPDLITEKAVSKRTLGQNQEDATSGSPVRGGAIQISVKIVGVFPHPSATCLSLSQNISLTSSRRNPLYAVWWSLLEAGSVYQFSHEEETQQDSGGNGPTQKSIIDAP